MTRVLILDGDGVGLDLALRCLDAGHEVKLAQVQKKPTRNGEGFPKLERITDWKAAMAWAKPGIVIPTCNNKFINELERYRDLGFNIFGPTKRSEALEIDRAKGLEAMQKVGIEVPHYETFDSLKAAEAFARKADQAYVFKTMGDEEDKSLSYVASDPADLVGWLQRKQAQGMTLKAQCMLQEKIDMVAELGVSGWFGPEGFLPDKWQICFEHKKLMPSNFGPNTGEMGTVCQYVAEDKMADEMLKPMEAELLKAGHTGDFAVGCGVDSKGRAWPFEFTARLGWPAFFIQCASHKGDPVKWMMDLLKGEVSLKVSNDVAIGVVMAQPQFPYSTAAPNEVEGNPISGVDAVWDHVHPVDMMIGKGPMMKGGKVVDGPIYQTAGEYVMVCTGLGRSVAAARKKVYDAVNEIAFANQIVRCDIGEKVAEQLPDLHKLGYALDMKP